MELKNDLKNDIDTINSKLLQPCIDCKNYTNQLKKTLKKRDNYKLDYERFKTKYDNLLNKKNNIIKDDLLIKSDNELSQSINVCYLFFINSYLLIYIYYIIDISKY